MSEGDWEEIERERVMGRAQREGGGGRGGVKGGRVEDERGGEEGGIPERLLVTAFPARTPAQIPDPPPLSF